MTTLWVLGEAGLAREMTQLARRLDPLATRWSVVRQVGPQQEQRLLSEGGEAVMGMGVPKIRRQVAERLSELADSAWPTLVHPLADIDPGAALGHGTVVVSGAVISTDVVLGPYSLVNYNATVGHDVRVGQCCVINPGAALSGGAVVEAEVLVGARAVVLEGRRIGRGATIGAGAVVVQDVAPGITVVGVPARPLSRGA